MNIGICKALFVVAACFTAASVSHAEVLSPSQVGNISVSGYRSDNLYLTVNWFDSDKNVGLVQFDVSLLGHSAVSSATLGLYHLWNDGSGAVFDIFQNTSAWNSNISSWSDLPTHLATPAGVLFIDDSNTGVWRYVDVTGAVNSWTSGSQPNYGFTIERIDQDNPLIYFSAVDSYWGGPGPTLAVTAVPEPETYAMLLAGLGMIGAVASRKKQVVKSVAVKLYEAPLRRGFRF